MASIIDLVRTDHEMLRTYYSKYKEAKEHDEKWFNLFVWELARHSVGEEMTLYPLLASTGEQGQKLADESRKDHHKLKLDLEEIMIKKDPKIMDTMFKELTDHMKMEEEEDLVLLEQQFTVDELVAAGKTFKMHKMIAPTRPHSMLPEKPISLEFAFGLLVAPIDKLRDLLTEFPSQQEADDAMKSSK